MTAEGNSDALLMHATTVAVDGRAVLIMGPSGSGKSALALQMLAFGAVLVADDQTLLTVQDGCLIADCPEPLVGLIEARGTGLLNAVPFGPAKVHLVVDLGQHETDRLPPQRSIVIRDVRIDLALGRDDAHFYAVLIQYAKAGRRA